MAAEDDIVSVGAEIDLANWTPNLLVLESGAELMDALQDVSVTASVEVVDEGIDSLLDLEALDGEEVSVSADVQETDTGKETVDSINRIAAIDTIRLAIDIAGTALDFLNRVESVTVEPFLDLDDAVAKVNAQTANAIPNARELISGIFYDDLGDSVDQVGDLVIQAQQLKLPVDEAARAALTFTHTWKNEDPTNVLSTLNQLVSTGLAPSISSANDLLVTFYQNGGNKAGDAQAAIQKYAKTFADMGISGPEALSAINSLLAEGVPTANDAALALSKFSESLSTAASNPTGDQNKALRLLGLDNPVAKGQQVGADFINSFSTSLQDLSPEDRDFVITALFGKEGTKYTSAFEHLTTTGIGSFQEIKGAADDAATESDNSLRGALDDFTLAAQKAASDFLSSDSIDLPGKIEALKTGLQDALTVLQNGGSLQDAFTVALEPVGLAETFQTLEDNLTNFIIGLLQVVAQIQDATNHSEEAAATRREVSRLGQQQLAFELKLNNADEIAQDIQTATARGVTPEGIQAALSTAVGELVANGATEQAQALVDQFKAQKQVVVTSSDITGVSDTYTIPITPEMSDEDVQAAIDALKQKITDKEGPFRNITAEIKDVDVDETAVDSLQAQIDAAKTKTIQDALKVPRDVVSGIAVNQPAAPSTQNPLTSDFLDPAVKSSNDLAKNIGDLTTATDAATTPVTNTATAVDDLTVNTSAAVTPVSDLATTTSDLADSTADANDSASDLVVTTQDVDEALADANNQLIPVNQSTLTFADSLSILTQRLDDAISTASQIDTASAGGGSGGGGNTNTTNNSVNVTQNVQSNAQANNAAQAVADKLS